MKPIALLLTSLAFIIFASCSSDEPNKNVSLFESTFIETTPGYDFPAWITVHPFDEVFSLLNTLGVPYDETTEDEEQKAVSTYDGNNSYKLSLCATSAELTIDRQGIEHAIFRNVKWHTYKFKEGYYPIKAGDYGNIKLQYNRNLWVTSSGILLLRIDENDMGPDFITICSLEDYKLINYEQIGDIWTKDIALEGEVNQERFDAVTDPNGVVALRNAKFTYNFIPSTGMLTMISPEYKEIGVLHRIIN